MPELVVRIVGDTRSLEQSYKRAQAATGRFGRQMESAGRGAVVASIGFRGLGRAVGYASASFLGAAGFVTAVKAGFNEMLAGQAVAADTAAVLRSTGHVAGVTAGRVDDLAKSLQRMSGYDDEAVASAENLILTFTNVRDVAGKGNDVFTQTIKSTLDLSRRFDQDLSTSAVQLGKALQDPVRGVTALRRAGISFSESQQRTIRHLVETGRVLDAQKIVLREVRRETGAAAEAYGKTMAGQIDILKGNLTNLAGEIAQTLNPEVKRLTENFNKWLENPENKRKIIDGFTSSIHGLGAAFQFAAGAAGGMKSAWDAIPDLGGTKSKGLIEILGDIGKSSFFQGIAGTRPGGTSFTWGRPGALGAPVFGNPQALAGRRRGGAAGGGAAPPSTPHRSAAEIAAAGRRAARMAGLRNTWFDAMVGRELAGVEDVKTIRGKISRLKEISGQITARISVTKDITRKLTLEEQVKEIARTIRSDQADLADKATAERRAREEKAKAARQKALETKRQKSELMFGWLEFAIERAEATKSAKKTLAADKALEAALVAKIKSEGRTLDLAHRLWAVRQKITDLNKQNAPQIRQMSAARIAESLGLAGDRRAIALLSALGGPAGHRTLPAGTGAFRGQSGMNIGVVHVHGVQDPAAWEEHMWKRQRSRAATRRGAR